MSTTRNKWRSGVLAVLTAGALAVTLAGPASADPTDSSGTPVKDRILNGTGSDTTQDVNNGLAATLTSGGSLYIGSWDATPQPSTIQPFTGGRTFARPNGSGQGVAALKAAKSSASWNGVTLSPGDLQFARSSSFAPLAKWSASGAYQYIPLAVDAVATAVYQTNTTIPTVGGNRTIDLGASVGETWPDGTYKLTLRNIYGVNGGSGTFTVYATQGGTSYTVGNQASGAQIVPFIPQSGSGTRQFWQTTITGSTAIAFGTHVSDTYVEGGVTKSVQEHDGSVLAVNTSGVPAEQLRNKAIVPFSISQHIAQTNIANDPSFFSGYPGVTVVDRRHGASLVRVDNVNPLSSSGGALNPTFPVRRPVFTVVYRTEYFSGTTEGNLLQSTFGAGGSAYSSTLADFGFGSLAGGVSFVIEGTTFSSVTPGEVSNRFRANP